MSNVEAPNVVSEAIDYLGGDSAVAKLRGLKTSWAVSKWRKRLPSDQVLWLAAETGWKYTPHMLATKLYPNPTDGLPPQISKGRAQARKAERRAAERRKPIDRRTPR